MKPLISTFLLVAVLLVTSATVPIWAQNDGEGTKAAQKIKDAIDVKNTNGTAEEELKKKLKELADKIGEEHPDDADEVKKRFQEEAKKIRDRDTKGKDYGIKNNKELVKWLNELLEKLQDKGLVSVPPNLKESGLVAMATGTGRTTGHIANLTLENKTNKPINASIGPFYIPSSGQYQPYIVPYLLDVTVLPNEKKEIPVEGFCTDIHSPPVPQNSGMPDVNTWIDVKPGTGAANRPPDTNKGWKPMDITPATGNARAVILGTDQPLNYTIDQKQYPQEAAPLLFDAFNRIDAAYDDMLQKGRINTPFKSNPEKEKQSVIQQTFWIYAAALTGVAYKAADFAKNTREQFEKSTAKKYDAVSAEQKKDLDKGVASFWETFNAVGVEAKVLYLSEDEEVDYDKIEKADKLPKQIRPGYDRYAAERALGSTHEKALEKAFSSKDAQKRWAEIFKKIYKKEGGK